MVSPHAPSFAWWRVGAEASQRRTLVAGGEPVIDPG